MLRIISLMVFLSIGSLHKRSWAEVSKSELSTIIASFEAVFETPLARKKQKLAINRPQFGMDWFDSPFVHSSYVRHEEKRWIIHELTIFGGLLKLPEISPETAALILCHELGHGIGGPPFKIGGFSQGATVEGQADYYATSDCLPKIFARWPRNQPNLIPRAIEGFQIFLKRTTGQTTDFWGRDNSVAIKLNTDPDHYPSPQCRIETLVRGWQNKPRPSCWFPSSLRK